ncbi:MAG: hypothetical protein IT289_08375 [Oligoflexia bacterium]|nr:hypothetical protein [Oligoflexia bacterium]
MNPRQLEFGLHTPRTPDRNLHKGGRSFYFFDFDDNVMILPTPLYVFHKMTGAEKEVNTHSFALIGPMIGKQGEWRDYELRLDPQFGSFRRFRQQRISLLQRLLGKKQPLVEDVLRVLNEPLPAWKGPSWQFFWHAVHNQRPLSIITARGHHPRTIKGGIQLLKKRGHITKTPNYLSIYPVSHLETRYALGDSNAEWHASKLKHLAILQSVEKAFQVYGFNPHHRFGMSDDDPTNLKLIVEAMSELKRRYPQNSFFVIDTHGGRLLKQEVHVDGVSQTDVTDEQLTLFD